MGKVGENPAALRAAVFSLSSKNLGGGAFKRPPPSRARVKPSFGWNTSRCGDVCLQISVCRFERDTYRAEITVIMPSWTRVSLNHPASEWTPGSTLQSGLVQCWVRLRVALNR